MRGIDDEDDVGTFDVSHRAGTGFIHQRPGRDGGEGSSIGATGDFGPGACERIRGDHGECQVRGGGVAGEADAQLADGGGIIKYGFTPTSAFMPGVIEVDRCGWSSVRP